jgi:hypothetical protein
LGVAEFERDVAAGNRAAEDAFWSLVAERHSPIIEPIPGNDKEVLATFVWSGSTLRQAGRCKARIC